MWLLAIINESSKEVGCSEPRQSNSYLSGVTSFGNNLVNSDESYLRGRHDVI